MCGAAPGALITVTFDSHPALSAPVQIGTDLDDCTRNTERPIPGVTEFSTALDCHLSGLAKGASRSYTFRISSPVANDASIQADTPWISVRVLEEQPGIRVIMDDPNSPNNYSTTIVTLA